MLITLQYERQIRIDFKFDSKSYFNASNDQIYVKERETVNRKKKLFFFYLRSNADALVFHEKNQRTPVRNGEAIKLFFSNGTGKKKIFL